MAASVVVLAGLGVGSLRVDPGSPGGDGRVSPDGAPARQSPQRVAPAPTLSRQVPPPDERPQGRWAEVMWRLQARRGEAWEQGRPSLLGRVYAAHSPLLARDREMLRGYAARGLRLQRLRLDVVRVDLLARQGDVARLDVVDVLAPVTVSSRAGHRQRLPDDRPSRHLVELRRDAAGWRISQVWAR